MSVLLGKKIKLFSLSANRELAKEIAQSIGLELSDCEVLHFADGEINVDISETVRGHHIFVIQPVSNPVNNNLMELLIMCDALKRASAKTINLVIPYYGYSRQDRKVKSRQPITAKLVADLIQTAGADIFSVQKSLIRLVSYYAFFKGWLLLSQPPGCLGLPTSFPT